MKKKLLIVLLLLLLPFHIQAKEKVFNICKEGCEYNRLLDVMIEANMIDEETEITINFKDEGPYYFLEDEADYSIIEEYEITVCTKLGGEYSWGQCTRNGESLNDKEMFSIVLFANMNLKKVTMNGVEGKTTIALSKMFDSSAFLSALSFPGVLFSDFEFNNIKYNTSVFFGGISYEGASRIEGSLNNCEIAHGLLAYGDTIVTVENSKLNNIYAIGIELGEEDYLPVAHGKAIIVLKGKNNTFAHKTFTYTEEFMATLRQTVVAAESAYLAEHPAPTFTEQKPERGNDETWNDYSARIAPYLERRNAYLEEYSAWLDNYIDVTYAAIVSVSGDYFDNHEANYENVYNLYGNWLSSTAEGLLSFKDAKEEYALEHPIPQRYPKPKRTDYATEEEYNAAYDLFLEGETAYNEWWQGLRPEVYDFTTDFFSSIGEQFLNLLLEVLFPGSKDISGLVEFAGGNVIVTDTETRTVSITSTLSLQEIADSFHTSIEEWEVMDQSIIEIRDGKIIPLKVGETEIRKVNDGNAYYVTIIVTPDMINPGTGQHILIIVLSLLGVLTVLQIITKKRRV